MMDFLFNIFLYLYAAILFVCIITAPITILYLFYQIIRMVWHDSGAPRRPRKEKTEVKADAQPKVNTDAIDAYFHYVPKPKPEPKPKVEPESKRTSSDSGFFDDDLVFWWAATH